MTNEPKELEELKVSEDLKMSEGQICETSDESLSPEQIEGASAVEYAKYLKERCPEISAKMAELPLRGKLIRTTHEDVVIDQPESEEVDNIRSQARSIPLQLNFANDTTRAFRSFTRIVRTDNGTCLLVTRVTDADADGCHIGGDRTRVILGSAPEKTKRRGRPSQKGQNQKKSYKTKYIPTSQVKPVNKR